MAVVLCLVLTSNHGMVEDCRASLVVIVWQTRFHNLVADREVVGRLGVEIECNCKDCWKRRMFARAQGRSVVPSRLSAWRGTWTYRIVCAEQY